MPLQLVEPDSPLRDRRLWPKNSLMPPTAVSFGFFIHRKTKTYRFAPLLSTKFDAGRIDAPCQGQGDFRALPLKSHPGLRREI
jgi:hypothetical protein